MFESVCLFAVYPEYNSEMNDPNVFKLNVGIPWDILETLGYPRSDIVLGWKVKDTGSISALFTLMTITPMFMHISLTTAIRHGFVLYEGLLVTVIITLKSETPQEALQATIRILKIFTFSCASRHQWTHPTPSQRRRKLISHPRPTAHAQIL